MHTLTFSPKILELKVMSVYSDSVLSSYHDYLMTVDCDNVIDSVDIVMIWLHHNNYYWPSSPHTVSTMLFVETGHWCGYMIYHVVQHTPAASLQTTSVNHDQHNTGSFSNIETHKRAIVRCKIDNIDTFCCALFIWTTIWSGDWRVNKVWRSKTYHNIRHYCVDNMIYETPSIAF